MKKEAALTFRGGGLAVLWTKFAIVRLAVFAMASAAAAQAVLPIACVRDADCREALPLGRLLDNNDDASYPSVCRRGTCTNPFYEQGCLGTLWGAKGGASQSSSKSDTTTTNPHTTRRVCHSDDPPEAVTLGYCVAPDPALAYAEIRIATQNWESAYVEAWMLQIVLQEVLGVPVTLETGDPDVHLDFYDPALSFGWGTGNDWAALENSVRGYADCRRVGAGVVPPPNNNNNNSNDDTSPFYRPYEPCAHAIPEVWATQSHAVHRLQAQGVVEAPMGLGAIGQQAWYIPKFVARDDPTLLTYFGLAGKREKMASTFGRPTTWGDYCADVSPTQCAIPDNVTSRPPVDATEAGRYHWNDAQTATYYTGHFRFTDENDCKANPDNCTGHIADYPCGWSSYVEQQAFHLDIALRSSGTAPGSRGYTYGELTQIVAAANATQSPIIFQWWTPDSLYQTYVKTDMEFQPVSMPATTQECMDATVAPEDRCHPDEAVRVGTAAGACAEPPYGLNKVVSTSLFDITQHPSIPEAQQNPAYDLIKAFSLTSLELGQIFDAWLNHPSTAGNGFTLRHATCEWMVENWDKVSNWIPRDYPRVTQKAARVTEEPLGLTSFVLAIAAFLAVLYAALMTYLQRQRPVIRHAQIPFLYMILCGLVFVTLGSLISLAVPSTLSCVASVWLVNLGFTLEVVPLIVKVGAVQRLLNAARQARRIALNMNTLYGTVAAITSLVITFLLLWSIMDTPSSEAHYTLSSDMTQNNETVVWVSHFCASESDIWRYLAALWHALLLVVACALAFSTRKIKTDFNENQSLTLSVFSHMIFVLLRVLTYALDFGDGGQADVQLYRSLIFSADSLVTVVIYFVSKFISKDEPNAGVVDLRTSQLSNSIITPNGVRNAALMNWTASSTSSVESGTFRQSPHRRGKQESIVCPSIVEGDNETSSSMEVAEENDVQKESSTTDDSPPDGIALTPPEDKSKTGDIISEGPPSD